ncbi:outer membrane protein assembly factor BamE [Oceanicola sp. S124]|uniref:outer membrane protein assembly factor BamE n=1 Tax=Oceanicola sp. S124 TaxID=1042378 RepID=UPI0002558192|nr:outer membrane protein assembly factor BamE [Oceanicola sp. S124]
MGQKVKAASRIVALAAVIGLSACTAQYRNHGYMPEPDQLEQVVVGVDTRDTVLDVIGAPTTAGVLDGGDYYYIRSRVKRFAYKRPEVVERTVLAISFDSRNVVSNIETFGLQDGQVVRLQSRVTSSSNQDKTFIRQLLGNIGRFDAAGIIGGE